MYIGDLSTEPIKNQAYTTNNYQTAHRIRFDHTAALRKDPNQLKQKQKILDNRGAECYNVA